MLLQSHSLAGRPIVTYMTDPEVTGTGVLGVLGGPLRDSWLDPGAPRLSLEVLHSFTAQARGVGRVGSRQERLLIG